MGRNPRQPNVQLDFEHHFLPSTWQMETRLRLLPQATEHLGQRKYAVHPQILSLDRINEGAAFIVSDETPDSLAVAVTFDVQTGGLRR